MLVTVSTKVESVELEVVTVASELFVQMAELLSGWYCCQNIVGEGYDAQLHDIVTVLTAATFVHEGVVAVNGSGIKLTILYGYTLKQPNRSNQ